MDETSATIRIDRTPAVSQKSRAGGYSLGEGSCEKTVDAVDPVFLLPIDLPEPLGDRSVLLPDETEITEIIGDVER